jgi:hypothetical protein
LSNNDLANKQNKSDSTLNTTSKTIVGAINETYGIVPRVNSEGITWIGAWGYGSRLFRIDRIVSFSGHYMAGTQINSGTKIGTIQNAGFACGVDVSISVTVYNSSHTIQNIKAHMFIPANSTDIYYYGDSPLAFQNIIGWSCSWAAISISQ